MRTFSGSGAELDQSANVDDSGNEPTPCCSDSTPDTSPSVPPPTAQAAASPTPSASRGRKGALRNKHSAPRKLKRASFKKARPSPVYTQIAPSASTDENEYMHANPAADTTICP